MAVEGTAQDFGAVETGGMGNLIQILAGFFQCAAGMVQPGFFDEFCRGLAYIALKMAQEGALCHIHSVGQL